MMRRIALGLSILFVAAGAMAQPAPCVITSFEGYPLGSNGVVMFRQPSFSGSTSGFLAFSQLCNIPSGVYNCARITDEYARTGSQSLLVAWQFTGALNAWLRLTTFNTLNLPNPNIDFSHKVRFWLYVPSSTPDFYLTLGIRESGSSANCGANGGTTGGIEFVGSSTAAPPIGVLVDQKDQWVLVEFDTQNMPLRGFAGATANGQLDTSTGTIEQLAFTPVDPSQVGPYIVYIDDIETVAPGPEGDVNGDGCVDDADLLQVLFAFGGSDPDADVNSDGIVDDADLLIVLFNFGSGC
ncbi:MAG: hypothetical protein SNJ72_01540 [Fimbriimonadales bacterium]